MIKIGINDDFYNENFAKSLERLTLEPLKYLAAEQDFIFRNIQRNSVVADLCCGTGRVIQQLAGYAKITGLDYSRVQINEAAKNLLRFNDKVSLVLGDARNPPLPSRWYDLALMTFNSINSLNDPSEESQLEVLAGANRILADDGTLIFTGWNDNAADVQLDFYKNIGLPNLVEVTPDYVSVCDEHDTLLVSRRFSPEKISELLGKTGFNGKIEKLTDYSLAVIARKA